MAACSSSSRRLEGKVAIITGGASGLGEAAARLFVENGAFVLIADIQDELGEQLVEALGADVVVYKHCDVTVESEVEGVVAAAVRKWGKLDVMLSNAGIMGKGCGEKKWVENMEMEEFDKVMGVNVRGSTMAVKHAAKAMVKRGKGGSIICTASVASLAGGVAPLDYTVSKHAIVGLVRSAASDLGKHGIRVNSVSPGSVITPLAVNYAREMLGVPDLPVSHIQAFADSVNVLQAHRSLAPLDIAHAALYLASDDSAFVSGLNLVVDGGFTATRNIVGPSPIPAPPPPPPLV